MAMTMPSQTVTVAGLDPFCFFVFSPFFFFSLTDRREGLDHKKKKKSKGNPGGRNKDPEKRAQENDDPRHGLTGESEGVSIVETATG